MMTQIGEVVIASPDGFYNYNFSVNGELIAKIEYDDQTTETQPWMVVVNDKIVTSFNAYAGAEAYILRNYDTNTLPKWIAQENSERQLESGSSDVKCVLYKSEYALIEGNHYRCGFKTKVVTILVSFQTLNAIMAMLDSLGLAEWELLDWWEVKEFAVEPTF